jgi:hypothetical protein
MQQARGNSQHNNQPSTGASKAKGRWPAKSVAGNKKGKANNNKEEEGSSMPVLSLLLAGRMLELDIL